ncbi:hypothetical protein Tco_0230948 [Tanacetum coccineum]
MVRKGDLKACKDCRVFPREACSSQHNLLALDILFKSVQRRREGSALPRILWKNLSGDATEAFRSRVAEGVSTRVEALVACDADSMWNALASIIKDAAKDALVVKDAPRGVAIIGTLKDTYGSRMGVLGNEEERLGRRKVSKKAKRQAKKKCALGEKRKEHVRSVQETRTLKREIRANDILELQRRTRERRRDLGEYVSLRMEEGPDPENK